MASLLARHSVRPVRVAGMALTRPSSLVLAERRSNSTMPQLDSMRNIGISAHIDSGKTTLTERILFYTGRIKDIHDVRGKDGIGAKMDSMDLEREKGITIQSAATFCTWGDSHVNIIDTPGHVDFTIEVERALRVLDGAVLVLCSVSGVQSQSITVDRQMKRYNVPRLAFINKCDRAGANPAKVLAGLRDVLKLNAALVQLPIGLEAQHEGCVDLVDRVSYRFAGERGEIVEREEGYPAEMEEEVAAQRLEMIERLAEVDEEVGEIFLMDEEPSPEQLRAAIRRATIARTFVPVFLGSAYKNKGVQPLLDGVVQYLPHPGEVVNTAVDLDDDEAPFDVECDESARTLALAFKLEQGKFGQLTYVRVYQGTVSKGSMLTNMRTGKAVKVPRLVRMHSNEMEEVSSVRAGDVAALFGVDCASMDSFTDGTLKAAMSSMFVPAAVMSLAIAPKSSTQMGAFGKALARFTKEDPTFRVKTDPESKQMIVSGMGELHLEVYIERMKREYDIECIVGAPKVNYRETLRKRANFEYLHKKQSGGSGQYAKVAGYVEPLFAGETEATIGGDDAGGFEFVNEIVGTVIPSEFFPSCEKGAREACEEGNLIGAPVTNVRVVVNDGAAHAVDSSDLAFRLAMRAAVREALKVAQPAVLEPLMLTEVVVPGEFQGVAVGGLNKRLGIIQGNEASDDGTSAVIAAEVPLAQMFGYSSELRSNTQGKGEFTMEYKKHGMVPRDIADQLIKEYEAKRKEELAA